MTKAIIFDIDGRLIDSVDAHAEAWQKAFEKIRQKANVLLTAPTSWKRERSFLPVFLTQKEIEQFGK